MTSGATQARRPRLIFYDSISDTNEEFRASLITGKGDYECADPEDSDENKAESVF